MTKINLVPYINDTKTNLQNVIVKLSKRGFGFENFKEAIINDTYKKYALLLGGSQIQGSLSPFMHSYSSFLNNNMFLYVLFEMTKENKNLKNILDFIAENQDILGANVTMPYKIEIYKLLNSVCQLDESAKLVGAVNTIAKNESGKLIGYNTDMYGIYNPIKEKLREKNFDVKKGYVLGAGGASRAAVAALLKLGVNEITVFNRGSENMINLSNHFNSSFVKKIIGNDYFIKMLTYDIGYDEKSSLWEFIEKNSILINTLPFGFKNHFSKYPIKESQFEKVFDNIFFYFDIVYDLNYSATPMISYLRQNYPDVKICDGIEMLVGQAKKGFEMWTKGQKFDEKKMIEILR